MISKSMGINRSAPPKHGKVNPSHCGEQVSVDDIGVTIVAQDIDEIEVLTNEAIFEIRPWLEEAGLTLAEHNTEVVLINKRRKQTSIKISALRTSSAYRTTCATCVTAGMIPIDILANESQRLYDPSYEIGEAYTYRRQLAQSESILEWQKRWGDSPKGRWTHRIIPDVSKRIKRRHGEVSYHLTQFLSGHQGYHLYLCRFGCDDSWYCPTCMMIPENAEHVIFNCPRFTAHRAEAEIDAGARLTPDNIKDHMLASGTSRRAVEKIMKAIHILLRREELRRKVTNNDRSRSS